MVVCSVRRGRGRAHVFSVLLGLACGLGARAARAEAPNAHATPVYVLSLSTDDVDDQADALTLALRSRVRESQGWSLLESAQSFDTLSLALKCPPKPDAACLQKVADQIHADHYVWGRVEHKKGAPEVAAELHLWSRSKGDSLVTTSFGDNLKDGNDPSLRKVAARAFGKLTNSEASGTLVVHAGTGRGSVLVDGSVLGALQGGVARVDVPEGPHKIAVRVTGFESSAAQNANVSAGTEEEVTFSLTPAPEEPPVQEAAAPAGHTSSGRKALAYTGIILGGGLLVGAGIGTALWINDNVKSDQDRQQVSNKITNVCQDQSNAYAVDACKLSKDATTVSMAAWLMGVGGAVIGGTGLVLLATDHSSVESNAHYSRPSFDVLPAVGVHGGSLQVRVTF
jgi:hypothetical protein